MNENLRIHYAKYQEEIHPWIQNNLRLPHWRFYWNPVPGGCLRVAGERIPLEPEYFYIIPGYLIFSTFAEAPFSQFYIHFNPNELLRRWSAIVRLPVRQDLLLLIQRFIATEEKRENALLRSLLAQSILTTALLQLEPSKFLLPPYVDPRIMRLIKEIEENRGQLRSNSELAKACQMSCNSFIRLFQSEIGESPQKYCRRKRIELACELLHFSTCTIDEIAEQTGFANRFHFTRVFTNALHISPAAFARHIKKE